MNKFCTKENCTIMHSPNGLHVKPTIHSGDQFQIKSTVAFAPDTGEIIAQRSMITGIQTSLEAPPNAR